MSTYPTNLNRLLLLQNQVVRTITKHALDAHTEPIFKELGILKLNEIYILQIGKLMYLYKNGLLPYSFNNVFLMITKCITITQETNIPFIPSHVEQKSDSFLSNTKAQNSLIP